MALASRRRRSPWRSRRCSGSTSCGWQSYTVNWSNPRGCEIVVWSRMLQRLFADDRLLRCRFVSPGPHELPEDRRLEKAVGVDVDADADLRAPLDLRKPIADHVLHIEASAGV